MIDQNFKVFANWVPVDIGPALELSDDDESRGGDNESLHKHLGPNGERSKALADLAKRKDADAESLISAISAASTFSFIERDSVNGKLKTSSHNQIPDASSQIQTGTSPRIQPPSHNGPRVETPAALLKEMRAEHARLLKQVAGDLDSMRADYMDQISSQKKELNSVMNEMKGELASFRALRRSMLASMQDRKHRRNRSSGKGGSSPRRSRLKSDSKLPKPEEEDMVAELKETLERARNQLKMLQKEREDHKAFMVKARAQMQRANLSNLTCYEPREVENVRNVPARFRIQRTKHSPIKGSLKGSVVIKSKPSQPSPSCQMLSPREKTFACKTCNTHLGLEDAILSKSYQMGPGAFDEKKRGYLFSTIVNVVLAPPKKENFTTGTYEISRVRCFTCKTQMGWKYIGALEPDKPENHKKVGTFCISRNKIIDLSKEAIV